VRGRWAAGITPRNFSWIISGQLAVSERPGGQAQHHRPVRRQEEIIWLGQQGFTRVVSLLPSSHNLHAYDERGLASSHFPLLAHTDPKEILDALYPALLGWLREGQRVLVHEEQLSERLAGVLAGFLCWSGLVPEPPKAISVVENLLRRQLGAAGRSIVAVVGDLTPPAPAPPPPNLRAVEVGPDAVPDAGPTVGRADESS
jgi:hypothetical protein